MSDNGSQAKAPDKREWMIFVIIIYLMGLLIFATYSLGAMGLGAGYLRLMPHYACHSCVALSRM